MPISKQKIAWILAVITLVFTFSKLDSRVSFWYDKGASRFYQGIHYSQHFNSHALREQLKQLPLTSSEKISAQNNLVPHLANRTHIYHYPYLGDAEYIILSPPTKTFPLNEKEYQYAIDTLAMSNCWKPIHKTTELIVFRKIDYKGNK